MKLLSRNPSECTSKMTLVQIHHIMICVKSQNNILCICTFRTDWMWELTFKTDLLNGYEAMYTQFVFLFIELTFVFSCCVRNLTLEVCHTCYWLRFDLILCTQLLCFVHTATVKQCMSTCGTKLTP